MLTHTELNEIASSARLSLFRPNLRLGDPVDHAGALTRAALFTIFDDRAVIFGTETATAIITDQADIADYDQRHTFCSQLTVVATPSRSRSARQARERVPGGGRGAPGVTKQEMNSCMRNPCEPLS